MKKFGPGECGSVVPALTAEKIAEMDAEHDGRDQSVYVSYGAANAWGQCPMTAYVVPSETLGELVDSMSYALWKRVSPRNKVAS